MTSGLSAMTNQMKKELGGDLERCGSCCFLQPTFSWTSHKDLVVTPTCRDDPATLGVETKRSYDK